MLLKGFHTDIKNNAPIFEETQLKAFMLRNMESSYWLVRQAISIVFLRRAAHSGVPRPHVGKDNS